MCKGQRSARHLETEIKFKFKRMLPTFLHVQVGTAQKTAALSTANETSLSE